MNPSQKGNTRNATPASAPRDDAQAARNSGQFGADKPGSGKAPAPKRRADDTPHPEGPEYEEGGRYPGTREPGTAR